MKNISFTTEKNQQNDSMNFLYPCQNMVSVRRKLWLVIWWSIAGLIHYSFLGLPNKKDSTILHDNDRARSKDCRICWLKIEIFFHPPYFPRFLVNKFSLIFTIFTSQQQGLNTFKNREDLENVFEKIYFFKNLNFHDSGIKFICMTTTKVSFVTAYIFEQKYWLLIINNTTTY